MDGDKGIAETIAEYMPTPAQIAACKWLTNAELDFTRQNSLEPDFKVR
jgi:hypothetical protein